MSVNLSKFNCYPKRLFLELIESFIIKISTFHFYCFEIPTKIAQTILFYFTRLTTLLKKAEGKALWGFHKADQKS